MNLSTAPVACQVCGDTGTTVDDLDRVVACQHPGQAIPLPYGWTARNTARQGRFLLVTPEHEIVRNADASDPVDVASFTFRSAISFLATVFHDEGAHDAVDELTAHVAAWLSRYTAQGVNALTVRDPGGDVVGTIEVDRLPDSTISGSWQVTMRPGEAIAVRYCGSLDTCHEIAHPEHDLCAEHQAAWELEYGHEPSDV